MSQAGICNECVLRLLCLTARSEKLFSNGYYCIDIGVQIISTHITLT